MSARGNCKRDRWGRYLLPDPATGRERAYTRTTTLAKSLADTTALDRWKQRMVATGLATDPKLVKRARAAREDRQVLDALCEEAMAAAGAGDRATIGTELHSVTELVDLGQLPVSEVEPAFSVDVRAYVTALERAGIAPIPEYIEGLVINFTVDVAGTFDRIFRLPDGRLVIADLKTGENLAYSWGDIAIQLAVYANANVLWDWDLEGWLPMPSVDRTEGLVMHLPVGHGRCTLYTVDLAAGWQAARLASAVRTWRNRKDLSSVVDATALQRSAALLAEIGEARSGAELEALWVSGQAHWRDIHTNAAIARKKAVIRD